MKALYKLIPSKKLFSRQTVLAAVILIIAFTVLGSSQPANAVAPQDCARQLFGSDTYITLPWDVGECLAMAAPVIATRAASSAAGNAVSALFSLLERFFSWLLQLSANIFAFVLIQVNQQVGFYDNTFVQAGWAAVRDIASWFFIVILIVISFGTIFGLEGYSARRVALQLVIIGLLINFSLFFSALVINIGQLVMGFFVFSLGKYDNFAQALLNAGVGEQYWLNAADIKGVAALGAGAVNQVFKIIFFAIASFTFLFLAILLIIRIVVLWMHMILAPLAFVAAALPRTQSYFNQWLGGLLNWSFFGVIAAFFIWLSSYLMVYMNTLALKPEIINLPTLPGAEGLSVAVEMLGLVLKYITIIAFLLMSITISKRMAGSAATLAAGGLAAALGGAVTIGARPSAAAFRAVRGRAAKSMQESAGARRFAGRIGGVLAHTPFMGGLGERLVKFSAGRGIKKEVQEEKKSAAELGAEGVVATQRAGLSHAQKIARAEFLIEEGRVDLPGAEKVLRDALGTAVEMGDEMGIRRILGSMPSLAPSVGRTYAQAARYSKAGSNIPAGEFAHPVYGADIARNISSNAVSDLASKGNEDAMRNYVAQIRAWYTSVGSPSPATLRTTNPSLFAKYQQIQRNNQLVGYW